MIDITISHYKILKKLGKGGMGEVYVKPFQDGEDSVPESIHGGVSPIVMQNWIKEFKDQE